jgi:hypothetical protein
MSSCCLCHPLDYVRHGLLAMLIAPTMSGRLGAPYAPGAGPAIKVIPLQWCSLMFATTDDDTDGRRSQLLQECNDHTSG